MFGYKRKLDRLEDMLRDVKYQINKFNYVKEDYLSRMIALESVYNNIQEKLNIIAKFIDEKNKE